MVIKLSSVFFLSLFTCEKSMQRYIESLLSTESMGICSNFVLLVHWHRDCG